MNTDYVNMHHLMQKTLSSKYYCNHYFTSCNCMWLKVILPNILVSNIQSYKPSVPHLSTRHASREIGTCVTISDIGNELEPQLAWMKYPLEGAVLPVLLHCSLHLHQNAYVSTITCHALHNIITEQRKSEQGKIRIFFMDIFFNFLSGRKRNVKIIREIIREYSEGEVVGATTSKYYS